MAVGTMMMGVPPAPGVLKTIGVVAAPVGGTNVKVMGVPNGVEVGMGLAPLGVVVPDFRASAIAV